MDVLLVLLLVAVVVYGLVFYPSQQIKRLSREPILWVDGADTRYPDLPLGNLGLFCNAKDNQRVRIIFPKLTPDGNVEYLYSWHSLGAIRIPQPDKLSRRHLTKLRSAQQLANLVREHLQHERELSDLREQHREVSQLVALLETSDVYGDQRQIYDRALAQINHLLVKAEELQQLYIRFIREALIGSELAGFNPDILPDDQLLLDSQYEEVRAEYQQMKDTAIAYAELVRVRSEE